MSEAQRIANRVQLCRTRNSDRDADYRKLIAIRKGDYESVAPGLFNTSEFDKPLVANLIDTTARDIAEVMAPLPGIHCQAPSMSSEAEQKRADKREGIANGYVQKSRLQDQMFGGADRYGSFGFMAYIVEPNFAKQSPCIRVGDTSTAYWTNDYSGLTREYFEVTRVHTDTLCFKFPDVEDAIKARYGHNLGADHMVDVVRYYDDHKQVYCLLDPAICLVEIPNVTAGCPVRIVERPQLEPGRTRGQFDDVIWVQIARALVQVYTMNALEQSVNAPIVVPKDANDIEIGPFSVIQTDTPTGVGRVNLNLSAGLFPEFSVLAQEQRMGSRYPEGRSGSIDASIITGQGVQALMGTFDTQVQTFQRLNASALEDVIGLCFEMDEKLWGDTKKHIRIKDNGAPRELDYTPSKDIAGNYTVDVTYGAIAGLDPNRGLVFVLQALAGGLIAKSTARKTLPVELNVLAEERQIQLEQLDDSIAATIATLPQLIPQMAPQGMDPRELVMQIGELGSLIRKGKSPLEALTEVFAPKEAPAPEPVSPLEQAMGGGAGPEALPGAGQGGASDLLMSLAGMTASGQPNLSMNVSRMRPVA